MDFLSLWKKQILRAKSFNYTESNAVSVFGLSENLCRVCLIGFGRTTGIAISGLCLCLAWNLSNGGSVEQPPKTEATPEEQGSKSIAPDTQERDLRNLPKEGIKQWQPGDPVRVMDDLREDSSTRDTDKGEQQQNQGD